MAFVLEKLDIIKQEHDGTAVCYYRSADNLATISASGYFDRMANVLGTGSFIFVKGSDGSAVYSAVNTAAVITVVALAVGAAATVAEINAACDASAFIQAMTASGAITTDKKTVTLAHATVAIAATIATTVGTFTNDLFIKAILEPGVGQDHTVTITTGTWNGTNKVATFADVQDAILVRFDAAGNGTILSNTGSVAFSG